MVTERGTVYLMGRVTQREADRATAIARSISGVQQVVRVFEIVPPDDLRQLPRRPRRRRPRDRVRGAAPASSRQHGHAGR